MSLIDRIQRFLDELGVPVSVFCRKTKVCPSAYYAWRKGQLDLSSVAKRRIDEYLTKYNF